MNKITFFLLLLPFFGLFSCEEDAPDSVPNCIASQLKAASKICPDAKAQVHAYTFQGKSVFTLSEGNCVRDGGMMVVTETCDSLCFLGGFDGNIICNGDTFYLAATEKELVWEE